MEGGACGSTHSTFFLLEEKGRQFPSLKLLASLNDINLSDITVGSHPPEPPWQSVLLESIPFDSPSAIPMLF